MEKKILHSHVRTLIKALEKTREVLNRDPVNYDEIHSAKSILYAAIERMGMKAEKIIYSQRLLRELFSIVTTKADLRDYEKEVGLQIIEELNQRYQCELFDQKIESLAVNKL